MELTDLSSKVHVSLELLHSALLISYSSANSSRTQNTVVRYVDIDAVMIIPTGFLIDRKLEYIKLIVDNDSTQEITEAIRSIPLKSLGLNVAVRPEYSYLEKKIIDVEDYTILVAVRTADGTARDIRIHVDSNSVVEENVVNNKILRVKELSALFAIKVKREAIKDKLKLYFQGDVTFRYEVKRSVLNYLLARIMSSILSKEDNQIPVIVRERAALQTRIQGMGADSDGTYESYMAKAIHDSYSAEDLSAHSFDLLVLDAALNVSGKAHDARLVQTLFEAASKCAKELRRLETGETCSAKAVLEDADAKALLSLYRKLPPMLYLLRLYLISRSSTIELGAFQKYLATLLLLASSKESIVSFLASLAIRALVKVNKSIERRLETPDKKWIIKECNVISLIFKLLFSFMEKSAAEFFDKFFFSSDIHGCPVDVRCNG